MKVLDNPRLRGYEQAVRAIRGQLPQRYGFFDLRLFFPDLPAHGRRPTAGFRRRSVEQGDRLLDAAFADWVQQATERLTPRGEALPPVRTLEEAKMTLVERVAEWPKQWVREGIEQGLEQGLAHERALLRRQAASRFGEDTAGRLAEALAQITDPERLADLGEWLVRCDTGAELLARAAGMADRHRATGS